MPKSTFFNIPYEKQQRILEAAKNEFMRTPYIEASINRIIKEADIPRGSFYQYFEDKQDLFNFCLEEHRKQILDDLVFTLEKYKGDVFDCVISYIDSIIECIINSDMRIINMLMNNSTEFEGNLLEILQMKLDNKEMAAYDYINFDNLAIKTDEIETFLVIMAGIVVENINRMQYLKQRGALEAEQEIVTKEFKNQILLLKRVFTAH